MAIRASIRGQLNQHQENKLKPQDHVLREVVNSLRDIAIEFHGADQLRERMRSALDPLLTPKPVAVHDENARWAIEGAIAFGRMGVNKPPADDHWLMEYWLIGRHLVPLGRLDASTAKLMTGQVDAPVQAQEPRKPTNISQRLREYAGNPGYSHNDYADTMRVAADECESFYRGMVAWKENAQQKDRTIIDLRAKLAEAAPVQPVAVLDGDWKRLGYKDEADYLRMCLSSSRAIVKAHQSILAERDKEIIGLKLKLAAPAAQGDAKDTERLRWLAETGARISWSMDGEYCAVWLPDERDGTESRPAEGYPLKCYDSWHRAIDAAIAAKAAS